MSARMARPFGLVLRGGSWSAGDQLLAPVDVVRRAGHGGVGLQVHRRSAPRLEPDARAPTDHDHGLPEQVVGGHAALATSSPRAFRAATKISEKVGNGGMVPRSTSSGTWARIASVACCSHSPASGARAWAPVSRRPSLTTVR